MKTYAPDYYKKFVCIADKCRHSCCVGWEIDVDDISYNKYCNMNSDFGKKIKEHIVSDSDGRYDMTVQPRLAFSVLGAFSFTAFSGFSGFCFAVFFTALSIITHLSFL